MESQNSASRLIAALQSSAADLPVLLLAARSAIGASETASAKLFAQLLTVPAQVGLEKAVFVTCACAFTDAVADNGVQRAALSSSQALSLTQR